MAFETAKEIIKPAEAKTSALLRPSNEDMSSFRFSNAVSSNGAIADRELQLFGNGGFSFDRVASPYGSNDLIAQGFNFPNPIEAYRNEVEHRYRGRELETMNKEIKSQAWSDAYQAFPELSQIGEGDATKLMKAIIANELEHFDPIDLSEDAAAKTGHGGALHGKTIGFAQVTPDGVRDMAKQLDAQVERGERTSNPLANFEKLNKDQLAQAVADPANAPLFVAAHMALDLATLNRHKSELQVTPEALGYIYNADRVYAKTDTKHEHLLTKSEVSKKHIDSNPAWPTESVLQQSSHAGNIRRWLKKV